MGRDLNLQRKFKLYKYKKEGDVSPPLRLFFLKDFIFNFRLCYFQWKKENSHRNFFIVQAFHVLFCRKLICDYIELLKEKATQLGFSMDIFHPGEFKILHTNNSVVRRP